MSNARNIASIAGEDVLNASNEIVPVYACRAWVNFDGTTNTAGFCTIRDSGNVSTVADNGTGDYTINFENEMPDENHATVTTATMRNSGSAINYSIGYRSSDSFNATTYTASSVRIMNKRSNAGVEDVNIISVATFH